MHTPHFTRYGSITEPAALLKLAELHDCIEAAIIPFSKRDKQIMCSHLTCTHDKATMRTRMPALGASRMPALGAPGRRQREQAKFVCCCNRSN
jgi:hypothetical protein